MCRLIISFILLASTQVYAEPEAYIKACFNCHGNKGISSQPNVPTIAGASSAFIEATLFAYQEETRPAIESPYYHGDTNRPATNMKIISDQLSDEQILTLADYFSSLPFVAAKQTFDADLAVMGKQIHAQKCNKCHQKGGSLAEDDSGILAGQWKPYLEQSMKFYRDGSRYMEKKMKNKIDQLTDKEWQALVAYYASQQD